MRRLYSTFAGGWPGIGLFLLRFVVGLALVMRASATLAVSPPIHTTLTDLFAAACGLLLIIGLWTPIVGALLTFTETSQVLTGTGERSVPLLLATIGCALAMLGPGLWSIDARLFGWKRVDPPPRNSSVKPF